MSVLVVTTEILSLVCPFTYVKRVRLTALARSLDKGQELWWMKETHVAPRGVGAWKRKHDKQLESYASLEVGGGPVDGSPCIPHSILPTSEVGG